MACLLTILTAKVGRFEWNHSSSFQNCQICASTVTQCHVSPFHFTSSHSMQCQHGDMTHAKVLLANGIRTAGQGGRRPRASMGEWQKISTGRVVHNLKAHPILYFSALFFFGNLSMLVCRNLLKPREFSAFCHTLMTSAPGKRATSEGMLLDGARCECAMDP